MTRQRVPRVIETGAWDARGGRTHALVENPDAAQLWAYAETLREAGYGVAIERASTRTGSIGARRSRLEGARTSSSPPARFGGATGCSPSSG